MTPSPVTPAWIERMSPRRWYAISGDRPDLDLPATAPGTRFLLDNDPARDPRLNPARTMKEQVRRALGRAPRSPWHGAMGFSAITEAWNGAVYASRHGAGGSMIVFGGGHNDYFGSDVHAFDLASREWRRIADGYVSGGDGDYGAGARYPDSVYPDGSPLPPHTYGYVQYDPIGNDYLLLKGQAELGPDVEAVAIPHLFNLDTLRWRHGPRHPTAVLNSAGWTSWDASRRVLWGHSGDDGGGNAFIGFCPDGANGDGTFGRWTERFPNKLPGIANHNAMQIDPVRDVIVVAVHARDALHAIDPDDPGREIARPRRCGSEARRCVPMRHWSTRRTWAGSSTSRRWTAGPCTRLPVPNGKRRTSSPGSGRGTPAHRRPVRCSRSPTRQPGRAFRSMCRTRSDASGSPRSAHSISRSWSGTSTVPSMR